MKDRILTEAEDLAYRDLARAAERLREAQAAAESTCTLSAGYDTDLYFFARRDTIQAWQGPDGNWVVFDRSVPVGVMSNSLFRMHYEPQEGSCPLCSGMRTIRVSNVPGSSYMPCYRCTPPAAK